MLNYISQTSASEPSQSDVRSPQSSALGPAVVVAPAPAVPLPALAFAPPAPPPARRSLCQRIRNANFYELTKCATSLATMIFTGEHAHALLDSQPHDEVINKYFLPAFLCSCFSAGTTAFNMAAHDEPRSVRCLRVLNGVCSATTMAAGIYLAINGSVVAAPALIALGTVHAIDAAVPGGLAGKVNGAIRSVWSRCFG